MPITYATATKTARMNAVVTALGASAKLEIGTSAMASILATITLDATAGTVSNGVLTLSGMPKNVAAALAGTAAAARLRTSANADVITGLTVGTSGADVIIDNTNIASGQTVNCTSVVITHAA
jgi:hypothetical protein